MPGHHFDVVRRIEAPVDTVWGLAADARGWKTWTMLLRSDLEREGAPTPDGVGALRVFGAGPVASREEVVAFDPPHHLAYVLRSGLPLNGYRATVDIVDTGGGVTILRWQGGFRSAPRGTAWLFGLLLHVTIWDFARRLQGEAQRRHASGGTSNRSR